MVMSYFQRTRTDCRIRNFYTTGRLEKLVDSDEKTNASINSKLLKKLDHVNTALYAVELVKAQLERKEPIIVGFFLLQHAKLRMLELYYIIPTKFCYGNKFEKLKMDTSSLYLALAEKKLEDFICPEKRTEWEQMRSKDYNVCFTADAVTNFFPWMRCDKHEKHGKRAPGLFKEKFRCTEMLWLCEKKHTAATPLPLTTTNSATEDSKSEYWSRGVMAFWKSIAR